LEISTHCKKYDVRQYGQYMYHGSGQENLTHNNSYNNSKKNLARNNSYNNSKIKRKMSCIAELQTLAERIVM